MSWLHLECLNTDGLASTSLLGSFGRFMCGIQMVLQSFPGADNLVTVRTVVCESIWKVLAFYVVSHVVADLVEEF